MPVGPGKFRVKTFPSGKKVRLHITPSGGVNEVKSLSGGGTHTAAEFEADRKRSPKPRNSLRRKG